MYSSTKLQLWLLSATKNTENSLSVADGSTVNNLLQRFVTYLVAVYGETSYWLL